MRIGINLLNFDCTEIDGVGYITKRLLHKIQETDDSNIYFLYTQKGFEYDRVFNIKNKNRFRIIEVPNLKIKLFRVIFKLFIFALYVKKKDIDLFFSPAPPIPVFISPGILIITAINDLTPLIIDRGQSAILKCYYRFIVWLSIRRSDKVIAISKNTERDIINYFKKSKNKVECIYPFITEITPEKVSISEDFFITVSTIQPGKNLENVIRAFQIFLTDCSNKDFKLYVIGKNGWGYENIYALPGELGLEKNIIFTGYLDEMQLNYYYKTCTALIYISLYEGFGLPVLEAMYYGKPSVVSDTSSLPEVVGDTGILVDPYDINSIAEGMCQVSNDETRKKLTGRIPEQIKKFDSDKQFVKLRNIFEALYRG